MEVHSIFTELAAAVNGAQLQGNTHIVSAFNFAPESIVPPHFEVAEFQIAYHQTMGTDARPAGLVRLNISANLLLSRATDESGQLEAQRLAGSGTDTIVEAILAARGAPGELALNGAAHDCYVQSARGPVLVDYGADLKFYGIEFTLFVIGE